MGWVPHTSTPKMPECPLKPKKCQKKGPKIKNVQKHKKCNISKLTNAHPQSQQNPTNCPKTATKNHSMQRKVGLNENPPKSKKMQFIQKELGQIFLNQDLSEKV